MLQTKISKNDKFIIKIFNDCRKKNPVCNTLRKNTPVSQLVT